MQNHEFDENVTRIRSEVDHEQSNLGERSSLLCTQQYKPMIIIGTYMIRVSGFVSLMNNQAGGLVTNDDEF